MKNDITQRFTLTVTDGDNVVEVLSNRIYECGKNRPLAKQLKVCSATAIRQAAESMRWILPSWDNVAIIPVPSHLGYPTYTLQLARALGGHVYNILRCEPRDTLYEIKKSGKLPKPEQLGFYTIGTVPANKRVVFIDNVVATGTTALACKTAVGRGIMVTFAISLRGMR